MGLVWLFYYDKNPETYLTSMRCTMLRTMVQKDKLNFK